MSGHARRGKPPARHPNDATQTRRSDKPNASPHRKRAAPAVHGYFVQLGAFRNQTRARALMARLKSLGWRVHLQPKSDQLHAVMVGPWPKQDSARKARGRLRQQGFSGFVLKR